MSRHVPLLVLLACGTCATVLVARQGDAPSGQGRSAGPRTETISGSSVISPSVIGSYIIRRDETGNGTLEVLVLWRGSPGWFQRRSVPGSSMGGGTPFGRPGRDPDVTRLSVRQGGLNLTAIFDATARVATVLSDTIPLKAANVILVDDVDDPAGPRVLGSLAVEPALGRSPGPYPALIASAELLEFLRCYAQTPDPSSMSYVCAEAIYRGRVTGERTMSPIPEGPVQNRAADPTWPQPPRLPTGALGSAEAMLSPVVFGGWFTHSDASGTTALDLLVLWRGSPGWALRGSQSGGSGGGGGAGQRQGMTIKRGDLMLHAVFDPLARSCEIEGQRVPLGDDNVVLVDDVDSSGGPRVVKTLRVDPALSDATRIDEAIRRSPELVAFLRCDLKLPNERQQAVMDILCSRVIGK